MSAIIILIFSLSLACGAIGSKNQLQMKIGEFNQDYGVYLSYTPQAKTRIPLSLIDDKGNVQLRVTPRYQDDYVCGRNAFIMNTKFNGKWNKQIRPKVPEFNYKLGQKVSMSVIPVESFYQVTFDFGSPPLLSYKSFNFRHGHIPSQVVKISGGQYSHCSKTAKAKLFELSIGRIVIPGLGLNSTIGVLGTAPGGGKMTIDITFGERTNRDDGRIALRINADFDAAAPKILLQHQEDKDHLETLKTVPNPIKKDTEFSIKLTVEKFHYLIEVDGHQLATYPLTVSTMCECGERKATVWVTGAAAVKKITVQ